MKIIKVNEGKRLEEIRNLYKKAFPVCEQKPFCLLLEKQKCGCVDILALEENTEFAGLAIMAKDEDRILLDYLAVAENKRGYGIGSKALAALAEHYDGKRMIIEIESTKTDASDHDMRVRRKEFYHRNGMTDLPFDVDCFGTEMETLSNGTPFTFGEYWSIYKNVFGSKISDRIRLV